MTRNTNPRIVQPPVVCSLSTEQSNSQFLEWSELQKQAISVTTIAGGALMTFPGSLEPQVRDLATRESTCCAFLDMAIHANDNGKIFTLEVTSTNPDALPVIAALAGTGAT